MNENQYNGMSKGFIINLPTLHASQFDDLKIEDVDMVGDVLNHVRVWVSRVETMMDDSPQVTVEKLVKGEWETISIF